MIRFINIVGLALIFMTGPACAISKSSESISTSISSPFKWSSSSSASSSDAAEEASYEADVSEYSYAFARAHQDPQTDEIGSFRAGLGRLAEKHGITDWEGDPLTVASIGRGFGKTEMDESQLRTFSTLLFGANLDTLQQLERGLASTSGTTPPVAAAGNEAE